MQAYEGDRDELDIVVEVEGDATIDDAVMGDGLDETVAFDAELTVVTSVDEADAVETILLLEDAPALELPVWEPTGDAEVDAALEQLRLLDDAELADHVSVFTDVHAALHQRLSDIAGS